MKNKICILLSFITAVIFLSSGTVYAEEQLKYPYRTALEQDTYCYEEPDAYSKPVELLKAQDITVLEKGEDGWVLISTYRGELWIQLHNRQFFMNLLFDIYDAPNGEITSGRYLPQMTTVYEIKDGWHKIDSVAEAWVKPNLLNGSIIHSGKSWNQYRDDQIYTQKTKNACELYAAASALNSLTADYAEHPLQLIEKVTRATNPYEGFNENYGMYAQPLTDFINTTYEGDFFAYNATGISVDNFRDILARNGRIVAWIETGKNAYAQVGGVQVLLSSHTITVVGIDDEFVYITNSNNEGGVVPMNRKSFERGFSSYFPDGNQAVVIATKKNEDNMTKYLHEVLGVEEEMEIETEIEVEVEVEVEL